MRRKLFEIRELCSPTVVREKYCATGVWQPFVCSLCRFVRHAEKVCSQFVVDRTGYLYDVHDGLPEGIISDIALVASNPDSDNYDETCDVPEFVDIMMGTLLLPRKLAPGDLAVLKRPRSFHRI